MVNYQPFVVISPLTYAAPSIRRHPQGGNRIQLNYDAGYQYT